MGLAGMKRPRRPAMPTRHKILSMDVYRIASGILEIDGGLPDQPASSVKAAKVMAMCLIYRMGFMNESSRRREVDQWPCTVFRAS